MADKLVLKRGDHIIVERGYTEHPGTVISASNYGTDERPDWYIEFKCDLCAGSHYWKQQLDGGTVRRG